MLELSIREEHRLMIVDLTFRRDNVGGPVIDGRASADDLAAICTAAHVVFIVHGFNHNGVGGAKVVRRFAELLKQQGVKDAVLVGVTWPGDDKVIGLLGYPYDIEDANRTGAKLAA